MTPLRTAIGLTFLVLAASVMAQDGASVIYAAPDELDAYWTVLAKQAPKYPRNAMRRNQQGCVTVSYIIERDGRTSSHTPLAMMPGNGFTKSAIKAAKTFRYAATEQNADGGPVLTFTTFTYLLGDDQTQMEARRSELNAACTDAALEKIGELTRPDS